MTEANSSAEIPGRLYKYMPSRYVSAFVSRGALLFRNLSYFRKCEEKGRADLLEGLHMEHPDNPITIQNLSKPTQPAWVGNAAFLNSIDPDRVFVFCLSALLSPPLFQEFRADACVEIVDTEEFIRRVTRRVIRLRSFMGLFHKPVYHYAPNKPAPVSVTDPLNLPFFKHEDYSHQCEYRLVLPLKRGLKLTRRIVHMELHSFEDEVAAGISKERHIEVGSLEDITVVHRSVVA